MFIFQYILYKRSETDNFDSQLVLTTRYMGQLVFYKHFQTSISFSAFSISFFLDFNGFNSRLHSNVSDITALGVFG